MVWAILPLVLGITYLIVLISKEKFGYSVPISVIVISLFLYFSQIIFSTFYVGIIGFALFGLIGIIFAILSMTGCVKTSRFNRSVELFFSPGFYGFIVVFLFALLAYGGRHFSSWDELSHWGPMVKEMFRLDRFYIIPEARDMAHKDYPPIIQLFELMVCKFSGTYSEGKASMGIQIVLLSFLTPPMMEKFGGSKALGKGRRGLFNLLIGMLLLSITVLCFLWFDVDDVYKTIYNDCAVCAVGVYVLSLALDKSIITNSARKVFLLFALFYFPLCKQISLAFILLVYFAVITVLVQEKAINSKWKLWNIVYIVAMFVVPATSLIIWSRVTAPYNLYSQFDLGSIRITDVILIMIGRGSWLQHTTYMSYLAALLNQPITAGAFKLGYVTVGILAIFLLTIMYFKFRIGNSDRTAKNEFIRYFLVFAFGIIGYAFTMFVMYMYGFSEVEMLRLASFPRYMATYACSMFFLLIGLFIEKLSRDDDSNEKPYIKYCILATVCILLMVSVDQRLLTGFLPKVLGNEKQEYQSIALDIDSRVEYDDRVLLISEDNNTYYTFLRYYCDDALVYGSDYSIGIPDWELEKYDYVYVINTNDSINDLWIPYLADSTTHLDRGIYSVIFENGEYKLKYIQ